MSCPTCGQRRPEDAPLQLTEAEIEAGKSPAGGYTRAQLAAWGVPWPPPQGWRQALLAGTPIGGPEPADTAALLRQLTLAVIERGHAEIVHELPELLAYFGAELPPKPWRTSTGTNLTDAPF